MSELDLNTSQPTAGYKKYKRRRSMLPWWVIGFIWIFMVFAALVPVAIVFGAMRLTFQVSLLGLSAADPFSGTGIFVMLLFAYKGLVAFGLWTEKTWAIDLAKIDAALSTVICLGTMGYSLFGPGGMFSLRLELIATIPYYFKMNQIEYDWKNFDSLEAEPFPMQ
ncbi:MAG: hypothetical protein V4577_04795 [Bacteroidota bacterium]